MRDLGVIELYLKDIWFGGLDYIHTQNYWVFGLCPSSGF
jgi:hypothetical protein